MGPAMNPLTPPPGAPVVSADTSIARLHGEACFHCGAVNTGLQAAGEVSTPTDGGFRVWPVVACTEHRGAVEAAAALRRTVSTPVPMVTTRNGAEITETVNVVHMLGETPPPEIRHTCGPTCGRAGR